MYVCNILCVLYYVHGFFLIWGRKGLKRGGEKERKDEIIKREELVKRIEIFLYEALKIKEREREREEKEKKRKSICKYK